MLTSNLLLPFGLVNGTMGTLVDIVWRPEEDPFTPLPSMLVFKPDAYDGPSMFQADDGRPVVPLFPMTSEWEEGAQRFSRTMYPVAVAYAITVHKSQGLTLDRAVLDLTKKDFAIGLTYVAVSRVRTVDGLMIDHDFSMGRFEQGPSFLRTMRAEDKSRRSAQIVSRV